MRKGRKVFMYFFWLWLLFIFVISLYPKFQQPINIHPKNSFIRMDYIEHFLSFFILSVLFYLWKNNVSKYNLKKTLWFFFLSVVVISFVNEGIQFFIPGRSVNGWDIFYNISGMLAGMLLWLNTIKIKRTSDNSFLSKNK